MIPVTQQYKDAVYATSRATGAKIIFQIVDVTAQGDASAAVTSEASISKKDQIIDGKTELSGKYATYENNYWKLDGSFVLPPKPTETGYDVGWWSSELSGANGTFVTPQVITLQFATDHSSIGLTIIFDQLTNEYAADFTIQVYDSVDNIIHTETVIGNALSKYLLEQNLSSYRKVVITITKWATGYRRARITEVAFGIVEEYTGSEIIGANVLEEIDTTSNQVSSNEVKFVLDNQSKDFNILNPDGIYPYLQRRQKIQPYIGIEKADTTLENIPMGVYYLIEWKSDEGTLTASFTARDILDILAQDDYAGDSYTAETLYDIAVAVFTAAGIADYEIDTALQSIAVTGTLPKANYKETLQTIALAGKSVLYSDRYGKAIIKQLDNTALSESITYDNVYASPLIKLDKLINTIYVDLGATTYTYVDPNKPAGEQTLSAAIDNPLINTEAHAADVAVWLMTEYKKRFLYEISWRMNPAYEPGDIVTVEDDFSEDKTVRITKQEFNFAGYLSGKTNGRGGG